MLPTSLTDADGVHDTCIADSLVFCCAALQLCCGQEVLCLLLAVAHGKLRATLKDAYVCGRETIYHIVSFQNTACVSCRTIPSFQQ